MRILEVKTISAIGSAELRLRAEQARVSESLQFIAKELDVEVGFLSLDFQEDRQLCQIYEVMVLPEYRRRGLGRELVAFAEHVAKSRACSRIQLTPQPLDPSIDREWLWEWYRKLGYLPAGDYIVEKRLTNGD